MQAIVQKITQSQAAYFACQGWKGVNYVGKMNILFVASVWFVIGESLTSEQESRRFYHFKFIQDAKPTRSIYQER